jgi:CHAT domain-containing protein
MVTCRKILLLIFLFPLSLLSQKVDSAYVALKNQEVGALRYEGKFEQAYNKSNDLLIELHKKNANDLFFAETYFTKSRIEIELGKYELAFDSSKKALDIYLKKSDSLGLAQVYNVIGVYYYFQNDLDSTLTYYLKSYDIKKKLDFEYQEMAVSAYNIAMVYEDIGRAEEAMELYLETEKYLLKEKGYLSFLSDVYIGIAHIYKYKRDFDQAEKYADKAMDVGLQTYSEFNPHMTFVYTSYANILISKNKFKEGIELLKKGLEIRKNTYGINHKWTCESYSSLAKAYELDGQIKLAEENFKKSIEIGKLTNSDLYLANAKAALSFMYCDQNTNNNIAEKLLNEALEEYLKIYGAQNDIIAEVYYYLAKNAMNRDDEKAFFLHLNQAYAAGNYSSQELEKIIAPFDVLKSLGLQSDWLKRSYDKKENLDLLFEKFELIDKQIQLIKYLQKNYSSEISKISLANDYREVFEKELNTCWILFQKTKDKKYIEKAFELSETNRNSTLLEGLQDSKFKLYGAIPEELLLFEHQLEQTLAKVKMDLYYEKDSGEPDKELLSSLIYQRTEIGKRLDSLHKVFDTNYPKYANLKYQDKTIQIAEVQKALDNDTQLMTYFLGENDLYTFTITKDKIIFLKGEVAKNLALAIDDLKTDLVEQKDVIKSTKKLYIYLLSQQIDVTKKNLVIVPDNILNYIPFEILQNDNNQYLIENFDLSYSGSVHLFLELKNDYFKYSLPNYWAGFSPVYGEGENLSSNTNEISEISKIVQGNSFIGENSTKENFFNNYRYNSILHFAMHAEIDNNNPLYNKLKFSDGDLTASEIYIANIKANLAVLSACNTGFGKLEKGEGVMSMARAFNYAGVPAIIMSLWKVPDKETKEIMVRFYQNLNKGETKNRALKNAKLAYLKATKDVNLKHPYYWSGFVLNGNTDSLEPNTNKKNIYYLGGLAFIGLVFLLVKLKKKS